MGQYLIRIVTAGLICAFVTAKFSSKDAIGRLIRLLCGIFMTLSVISPWRDIQITSIIDSGNFDADEMNSVIAEGEEYSLNAWREVITQQCRTYIVEKANGMGVKIDAEVVLNQGDPPTPCAVTITGGVSPYARKRLEELLMQDLGIPKEQQTWK